jgi:hypothetical protein
MLQRNRSHGRKTAHPKTKSFFSADLQLKRMKITMQKNLMISMRKYSRLSLFCLGTGTVLCFAPLGYAQPASKTFQQTVAQKAIDEWISFNAPNRPVVNSSTDVSLLEKSPLEYRKCLRINQFWTAVPAHDSKPPNGNSCSFNMPPTPEGKGQLNKWNEFPWSAAFISYIMNVSGAGNTFKYSGRHAVYIVASVKNRNTPNYPFRGYPINEMRPEVGDLICAPRGANKRDLTYGKIVETGDFQSHCDIVVAKNSSTVEAIGGNVGDTVAKTIVALDANGFLKVTDKSFRPWFVVIKNSAHP